MGVFLGQLPPAELARLKAELAETLIAFFCYPRFFDYRTNSLRTRPIDRAKRQEVWLFLSSVDFTTWNRVDLMAPDFQYQIERLLIHFVQRNRNFFGEQGRKRMSDIRMLISTSSASVVQGFRGHLSGNPQNNPPFGSPRPVTSWSTTNITGRIEPNWDKIAQATLLLQQQVQESRGEVKPATPQSDARPAMVPAQRSNRVQQATPASAIHGTDQSSPIPSTPPAPPTKAAAQVNVRSPSPLAGQASTASLSPVNAVQSANTVQQAAIPRLDAAAAFVDTSGVPAASVTSLAKSSGAAAPLPTMPEKVVPAIPPSATPPRSLPQPQSVSAPTTPGTRESTAALTTDGDVAIFEQLRHQLFIWLRIEAIRSGLDISNQGPSQLLELLRQQDNGDEARLQVVSTLLNLTNQVIKNGQASLFDYKQALKLHLIHTKR